MSYNLKAKRKSDGEIVEIPVLKNYFSKGRDGYFIDVLVILNVENFNELYEVVEEPKTLSPNFIKNLAGDMKNFKWEVNVSGEVLDNAPVEEWEDSFSKLGLPIESIRGVHDTLYIGTKCFSTLKHDNIGLYDVESVKQFIQQALQKEREQLVREIENKNISKIYRYDFDNHFNGTSVEEGYEKAKKDIIKLIQKQ